MSPAVEWQSPEENRQAPWSFQENNIAEDELGLLLALAPAIPSFGECWQSWKADQPDLSLDAEKYLDELANFALSCCH